MDTLENSFNKKRVIKLGEDSIFIYDNLKFEEIAYALCLSPDALEEQLINAAYALSEMFLTVRELVKSVREFVRCTNFYERDKKLNKIDFTRPNIQHQVLDRKPKQLIKKIIY